MQAGQGTAFTGLFAMYLHVGTVSPVVSEWVADAYCHTNFWLPWKKAG